MATAGDKCVVACKLPNGLIIDLNVKTVERDKGTKDAQLERVPGTGYKLRLHGSEQQNSDQFGGFGFTQEVTAADFEAWEAAHKEYAPVKAGLIWSAKNLADAQAMAVEFALVPSGFERLDFENPMGDDSIKPDDQMKNAKK